MARKYDAIDQRLLQWLRSEPAEITTAAAIAALGVKDGTTQRHISRRFTLLEDKGAIVCQLQGTTRVCTVHHEQIPGALHKGGPNNRTWRSRIRTDIDEIVGSAPQASPPSSSHPSIPASNSTEFEAAGGHVERLPSRWNTPAPKKRIGPLTLLDHISELD